MTDSYKIEAMTADDVAVAVNWAAKEGWNPGLSDAPCFYAADPTGFFKGVIGGKIVATGSAVKYGDDYAFCGLYIVAPEERGKGYGLALTQARLDSCEGRNVGIDGVLENVTIYERIGYKPYYENSRYSKTAEAPAGTDAHVKELDAAAFDVIKPYDRACFPASRDAFLSAWLLQPFARTVGYVENGTLKGYAVRRKCLEGYKVGPLFADTPTIASALFESLQSDIAGDEIILDTPGNNAEAIKLAEDYGMAKVFATMRMYQKGLPNIADHKVFGITSFELG